MVLEYSETQHDIFCRKFQLYMLKYNLFLICCMLPITICCLGLFVITFVRVMYFGLNAIYPPILFAIPLVMVLVVSTIQGCRDCIIGTYKVLNQDYFVRRSVCRDISVFVGRKKSNSHTKYLLADGNSYIIYLKEDRAKIDLGSPCDIVTITDKYGNKLWAFVIAAI